jgi:hypothetical protein
LIGARDRVLSATVLDHKERTMARIIVTADRVGAPTPRSESPVLLDERVNSIHLSDDHAAEQLIERLAWAVTDAEDAERAVLHA